MRLWRDGLITAAATAVLALGPAPAEACEPIHDLLVFGEPTQAMIPCVPGQILCDTDAQGNPVQPCVACAATGNQELCWASECRGFNGDTGQFGQFKKSRQGELEAIVMTIDNLTAGTTTTLVDQVQSPDCTTFIPTPTAGLTCTKLYKIKGIDPIGASGPGPLCTFDNLDDVNTIARTPMSQGVVLTDVNGRQCEARKKAGDQWWMFYQTCCSPLDTFGQPGDELRTTTRLVFDKDGVCMSDEVRSGLPEPIPAQEAPPCL